MRSSSELDCSALALVLIVSSLVTSRACGRVEEASLSSSLHLARLVPKSSRTCAATLQGCERRLNDAAEEQVR